MDISTKYKVNSKVYILFNEKIYAALVDQVKVEVERTTKIWYSLNLLNKSDQFIKERIIRSEKLVFESKKEAAYRWLADQDLDPTEIIQGFFAQERAE
jgi:hypothetical protein